MTPEQEQWLIQAVQNHEQVISEIRNEISEIRNQISETRIQNSEMREGQALLMDYLRQQDARRELSTIQYERDMREMKREIADLRQDFLNHMRAYHPPA